MAESKPVLLKFLPHNFKKLIDFGIEHMWKTRFQTYKNATIAMNIIVFMLDLRNDPVFSQIIRKEGISPLSLIIAGIEQLYARKKGTELSKRGINVKITIITPDNQHIHQNDIKDLLGRAFARLRKTKERKPVYFEDNELGVKIWIEPSEAKSNVYIDDKKSYCPNVEGL